MTENTFVPFEDDESGVDPLAGRRSIVVVELPEDPKSPVGGASNLTEYAPDDPALPSPRATKTRTPAMMVSAINTTAK